MVLSCLERPIDVFNITEWGVDLNRFLNNLRPQYSIYEWDYYLLRQNQIAFFQKNLPENVLSRFDNTFWSDFYGGKVPDTTVQELLNAVPESKLDQFFQIKETRKRLIAEFNLSFIEDEHWLVERIPARAFGQSYALTSDTASLDYRQTTERRFKEMPESLNCIDLQFILQGLSNELKAKNDEISFLNIIVHHTLVYCYKDQLGTNSPEGIHQDGMDYIVSALVAERKNIVGGKSIIYGSDMKTKIMETVLLSGQGILQPDKNTELWHEVTPIKCMEGYEKGYRSTIGFDITVMKPDI